MNQDPLPPHHALSAISTNEATPEFILTKEHRRFAEFFEACRRYRYIGLFFCAPGVGKPVSAQVYADWERLSYLSNLQRNAMPAVPEVVVHRTILYTVPVTASPGRILKEITQLRA